MRRRALIAALAVGAVVLVGAALLATTPAPASPAGPTSGAADSPQWQIMPGVRADFGIGYVALGWAANRAWIAHSGAAGDDMPVTSVRIAGAALRGFKTTHYKTSSVRLILGSELVYSTGQGGESLQARQLLASGGLGPPSAVPLDTRAIAPNHGIGARAAVRVGDRVVWALPGIDRRFPNVIRGVLWVCCATDGSAVELTRFIDRASAPNPVRLGLDERGRLWLAWHERGAVKIMELDPSSLLPRTTRPMVAPGVAVERFELACTAACRLVIEDIYKKGIHSWAPGERSPTKIVRPAPGVQYGPWLLAAASRSGDLIVAYEGRERYPTEVRVVRGNARGAGSRLVAKSASPSVGIHTHAAFVPAGLLVVTPKGALCEVCPVSIGLLRVTR